MVVVRPMLPTLHRFPLSISFVKAVIKSDEADSMLYGFRQMLRGLADGILAVIGEKRTWRAQKQQAWATLKYS